MLEIIEDVVLGDAPADARSVKGADIDVVLARDAANERRRLRTSRILLRRDRRLCGSFDAGGGSGA